MDLSLDPYCTSWVTLLPYMVQGYWDDGYGNFLIIDFFFAPFSAHCIYVIHGSFHIFMGQVTHPLCDRNLIHARLDAVSEIVDSLSSCKPSRTIAELDKGDSEIISVQNDLYYLLSTVLTNLGRLPDIQRGITRIFHRTATPKEVFTGKLLDLFPSLGKFWLLSFNTRMVRLFTYWSDSMTVCCSYWSHTICW